MDKGLPLKIIYFQQNTAMGACEEYFYLLMQGIDKNRFEPTFVCPAKAVLDPFVARVEALGIKVYRYSLQTSNLKLIIYLQSLFHRLRPDFIHFNDPCLSGIIAGRLAGVSVLLMTHHTPELNRKYNFKGRLMEKIALRHCGLDMIFTSEYSRDAGIKKDKISKYRSFVIYYGLPPEKFKQKYNKKEVCEEFLIDEKSPIIGNLARLSAQKGQTYLIDAAPIVIEKNRSVRFFFVGEGELGLELKARVRQKGLQDYFIFTGQRNDVTRILSAFEMLVMPSVFEGLCFAVIEASAMGIPVIASAVGGMRRSVLNGKTGLLVSPCDPKALAEAILWMLGHPQEAKEMGSAGKKYFLELFTQDRMVSMTEELYENLLTKNCAKGLNSHA
jgi:glycosyltransferase involved in cell wall biosynthesis